MADTALPQARPDAEIILCVSAKEGLVAIPVGEKYSYGHTALRSTGAFEKQKAGVHVLRDLSTMRDAMSSLVQAAKLYRVALTTSPRPYLGDYAQELASCLPGSWTATFEVYAHPVWQEDWIPLLWDNGELTEAMERCRIPYGAVLTSSTGAELLLIEQPGAPGGYLLGACASSTFDDNYDNPFAPPAIALPAYPRLAAAQVTSRFLPAYERAVHERLLTEVENGHRQLEDFRQSGGLDGGAVHGSRLGHTADHGAQSSAAVLRRLRPHAAHLLVRTLEAAAPSQEDRAALDRLAALLGTERGERPASVFRTPAPLPPASADDVRRWLANAPVLLKHARAALPPAAETGSRKALASAPRALAAPTTSGRGR
ncbi:hypothetical protein [Streptomyces sp. NPDC008122]|uniref:hypothetical protein n=1 Tax=Streptomyces sp. NPDC008122 TaxID=3364810 RepID=UPI0036E7FF62